MSRQKNLQVWTRRQALWLLAGATGGLALHGCARKADTNSAASGSSAQGGDAAKSLAVGVNAWPGYAGHYVALEKNWFKDNGVNVQELFFQDASSALTAFLAGKTELSWNTSADAIQLAEKDPSVRIIKLVDYSNGSDGILGRGITKPQDLKGKKVARENLLFENLLLQSYLEKGGLSLNDVTLIDTPVDAAATAFATKKVDVAVTYEPYLTKGAKQGGGSVIFSSKDTNLIADVIITREKTIKEKKQVILSYLRAVDKAVKLTNKGDADAIKIVGKRLGVSPEDAKQQLAGVKVFDIDGDKQIGFNKSNSNNLVENLEFTVKVGTKLKVLSKPLDVSKLYDDSLVKEL